MLYFFVLFDMRVRLITLPPLRQLKAWFPIPQHAGSIDNLKQALASQLGLAETGDTLSLAIDGWELLSESDWSLVLADGDIITYGGVSYCFICYISS